MTVCMKCRFIPGNTREQNGCSSGTRSDKQIDGKSYMCMWIFFFSFFFFLFESSVIGITVFALYVEVGKGCYT